jgi:hypothetical protein
MIYLVLMMNQLPRPHWLLLFVVFPAITAFSFRPTQSKSGNLSRSLYYYSDTIPKTEDNKEGEPGNGQPSISDKIFESSDVDVKATVDVEKWRQHLQKTLQSVLTSASKQGIPDGNFTVTVKFVVEADGTVTNAKAKNDPGFGLAEGAVKVVRTGPKWKPALKNGEIVRSYRTQPITFVARAAYVR